MKQDNEHRPAYLRLYERLRGEIVRGDYPFGARMPSKRQLAEEEGLSVVTVEHAYALLTDERVSRSAPPQRALCAVPRYGRLCAERAGKTGGCPGGGRGRTFRFRCSRG